MRHDVRQAATAVTEASHSNSFHRPWLSNRLLSQWCSPISTRSRPLSLCVKTAFCSAVVILCCSRSFCEFCSVANVNSSFINEPKEDNIIQQLLWAVESVTAYELPNELRWCHNGTPQTTISFILSVFHLTGTDCICRLQGRQKKLAQFFVGLNCTKY